MPTGLMQWWTHRNIFDYPFQDRLAPNMLQQGARRCPLQRLVLYTRSLYRVVSLKQGITACTG